MTCINVLRAMLKPIAGLVLLLIKVALRVVFN